MKTRNITEEEVKSDFVHFEHRKCDGCDTVGSYRNSEFYLCMECTLDICRVEVDDD